MTSPRRWSFGLRTLMLGVAILAGPMAWVGYSLNWIRERHACLRDVEWSDNTILIVRPPRAPGGLWIFGEKGEWFLEPMVKDDDPEIGRIQRLFPEASVAPGILEIKPPLGIAPPTDFTPAPERPTH